MMYDYYYGGVWPFHLLGGILSLALFLLVIGVFVRIIRGGWRGRYDRWSWRDWRGDTALDLLKERYVKGEISKEEYEEKYRVIMREEPPAK